MSPVDPASIEWRLSLLLLFLGVASLVVALIVGLHVATARDQFVEFKAAWIGLPIWGAVAVWLAFRVRRGKASNVLYFVAIGWFAVAMAGVYALQFANA